MRSLTGRLILGSALLLPLFLGASSIYLAGAHRLSLEAAEAQRLQLQVLTLLAQAEYDGTISLPERLIEARYNQPGSGLYARVSDAGGNTLWLSPSAVALPDADLAPERPGLRPGNHRFSRHNDLYTFSWQVVWDTPGDGEVPLLFTVMESTAPLDADIAVYRRSLALWLGGSAILLLACQGMILAWGLRPLRRLATEVAAIESGDAEHLGDDYPLELRPVTENLNALLLAEQRRRERARNTLADLAHSLKTPLAILRGANPGEPDYNALVREQTDRMEQIVAYQLQRASGGGQHLLQLIAVAPVLERLCASLRKVYADRHLDIGIHCDPQCLFRGDERDLMEILGNLLDNACKFARHRVRVSSEGSAPGPLQLSVEDDGPGIPQSSRSAILQRGARLDEQRPGQGLGLAVAADIIESYGGGIEIGDAASGGARIVVRFS